MASAKKATYVYCVASGRPSLPRAARGLPGAGKPRLLDAGGGLWLVVADAPIARYGEAAIARGLKDLEWVAQCALAHEAVVERVSAKATPPVKPLTLFSDA